MKKVICCLALLTLTLPGATLTEAAAVRSGAMAVAIATNTRGSAVAYDSVNHVYLVVSTFGLLRGRFVDRNGALLGAPFVIQASAHFTHFPTVTFSPDADGGAGGFLVVWHESDLVNQTSIHTRVVSFARSGPAGADTVVSVEGSFWEQYPVAAYSTGSREFLIAWARFGWGVRAIRVDNAGAAKSAAFTISQTGQFEGNPSVAYNPTTDQFLVVWKGWNNPGNFGFVDARLAQAGTNQLLGAAPTRVHAGGGTYITDVAYNSATNQFLAVWYRDAGGSAKTTLGRLVNADGGLPGNVIALSSLWKAYDGLGVAYNSRTGTFFMISHDGRGLTTSFEDGGVEIESTGMPVDNGFLVTSSADGKPNYYPRIAAGTGDPHWLVVTSHNFQSTAIQLVAGTPIAGNPTTPTTPTTPPPAPTPAPVMVIDVPSANATVSTRGFFVSGWALDRGAASGSGVDFVHVYAYPVGGGNPTFLGAATLSMPQRPDVGNAYGAQFTAAGYSLTTGPLAAGTYDIVVYARSTVNSAIDARVVRVTAVAPVSTPRMWVDTPAANQDTSQNLSIGGWALDLSSTTTSGVDAIHVWAYPSSGAAPIWLGVATLGIARPDVGNAFGASRYNASGFHLNTTLERGSYTLVVFAHSSVTDTFNNAQAIPITVR